jgi:hypothetical protein
VAGSLSRECSTDGFQNSEEKRIINWGLRLKDSDSLALEIKIRERHVRERDQYIYIYRLHSRRLQIEKNPEAICR